MADAHERSFAATEEGRRHGDLPVDRLGVQCAGPARSIGPDGRPPRRGSHGRGDVQKRVTLVGVDCYLENLTFVLWFEVGSIGSVMGASPVGKGR